MLPINAQQYLPRAVQRSTTMFPWKTKEADGSATAAARPERAASSGPPPPSPATPVGDQAPAPPKDDDWASPGCEPVAPSANLQQGRGSAEPPPSAGSLTPTGVGILPGLAFTLTEFPAPPGLPVQLKLADALPEANYLPIPRALGVELSFDEFEDAFDGLSA